MWSLQVLLATRKRCFELKQRRSGVLHAVYCQGESLHPDAHLTANTEGLGRDCREQVPNLNHRLAKLVIQWWKHHRHANRVH